MHWDAYATGPGPGPPICVEQEIRARGARFPGPLPLFDLGPRTLVVRIRNPTMPVLVRALLPARTDMRSTNPPTSEG